MKKGFSFLLLALLAFSGLGLEALLAFLIEPVLYGEQMQDWSTTQNILHWLITCVIWAVVAFVLFRYALKTKDFESLSAREALPLQKWIPAVVVVGICVAISVWDWQGFKPAIEFANNGALKFTFQYVYYIFEAVLVFLMIAFGQEAGERFFRNTAIVPWGGILTALTWGLVHAATKGSLSAAAMAAIGAVLYGVIYLFTRKNAYVAYLSILLAFAI